MSDFHSNFNSSIENCDIEGANKCLMTELGSILVNNRSDFVTMLNESSVYANNRMSDAELIDLFIKNAANNKKLILGASLLANMQNLQSGFDGEEEISDNGVKSGYAVMNSYFNDESYDIDEEQSNFIPVGLILKGVKALRNNRQQNKGNDAAAAAAAKQQMLLQAKLMREAEAKKKRKQQTTWIIAGGAALLLGIIVIVVVKNKK